MDPMIEKNQAPSTPKWIDEVLEALKPYLSVGTTFVPAWDEPEIYGSAGSGREISITIPILNSASIKNIDVKTDGKQDPSKDEIKRFSDGTCKWRKITGFRYVLVENGIRKDGVDKIEYVLHVSDERLYHRLRSVVGLK